MGKERVEWLITRALPILLKMSPPIKSGDSRSGWAARICPAGRSGVSTSPVETVSDPGSTIRIPGGRFRQFILEDEWVDVGEEGIKDFGKGVGESVAQSQAVSPPDIAGLAEVSETLQRGRSRVSSTPR